MNKRLKIIIEKLRQKNIRLTPQRIAVIKFLVGNKTHPTVDEIYSAIEKNYYNLSKATVYSTVELLVDLGEVKQLAIQRNNATCYDPTPEKHHHFLCKRCGKMYDIPVGFPKNCELFAFLNENGYSVDDIESYVYGLCPKCIKKSDKE